MSKRRRMDTDDEDVPPSKRIRIDTSVTFINPLRYNPDFKESNPLSSDDEPDQEMKKNGTEMEDLANASSFDNLLYQLASMNVSDTNNKEEQESLETCPICVARVSLSEFPNHVYACLDGMEVGDRHDLRSQLERDEDLAFSMVQQQPYRYSQDMASQCPICNKMLSVGMSMNVHVNECLDVQEASEANSRELPVNSRDDDDETMMAEQANGPESARPKPMTREQMSACANALLSNPKGSREYDSMLEMFGTLGFNEKNIRRAVEEEKGKKENDDDGDAGMMDEPSSRDPVPSYPPPQVAFSFGGSGGFEQANPSGDFGLGGMDTVSDSDL